LTNARKECRLIIKEDEVNKGTSPREYTYFDLYLTNARQVVLFTLFLFLITLFLFIFLFSFIYSYLLTLNYSNSKLHPKPQHLWLFPSKAQNNLNVIIISDAILNMEHDFRTEMYRNEVVYLNCNNI